MSYCANCGHKADGVDTCPDCGAQLVKEHTQEEPLVPVYNAKDSTEAAIVRGLLDQANIPTAIRTDEDAELDAFAGALEKEAVVVPVSREAEALKIIKEALGSSSLLKSSDEHLTPEEESQAESAV